MEKANVAKGSRWGFNALVSVKDHFDCFPAKMDSKFWNLRETAVLWSFT